MEIMMALTRLMLNSQGTAWCLGQGVGDEELTDRQRMRKWTIKKWRHSARRLLRSSTFFFLKNVSLSIFQVFFSYSSVLSIFLDPHICCRQSNLPYIMTYKRWLPCMALFRFPAVPVTVMNHRFFDRRSEQYRKKKKSTLDLVKEMGIYCRLVTLYTIETLIYLHNNFEFCQTFLCLSSHRLYPLSQHLFLRALDYKQTC